MANLHRGEIEAEIGGEKRTLCLTLGALAELEWALGARNLVELATRFEAGAFAARDIIAVIGCGLRGAGAPIADDEVARMTIPEGLQGHVRLAARLLAATFGVEPNEDAAAFPREPRDA